MTYLLSAILCSTVNHLLFKSFSRYRVNLLSAIVTNYAVCVLIGLGSSYQAVLSRPPLEQAWLPFSVIQGLIFVGCLFLIGKTTARNGVGVASLATRLSVTIPTVAAFFLYGDTIMATKVTGIVAALFALYLSCVEPKNTATPRAALSLLPVSLFLVFGAHSILIKFVQEFYLGHSAYHTYVMFSFISALVFSGCALAWGLIRQQQVFGLKELLFGAALGCTNYGSVYFLIRALGVPGWQSSRLFPTISIAVVGLSALGAAIIFKEKITRRMLTAFAIGGVSILLVNV